jgi:dTDP-4-amino-4,6-dideoxygalactose transaminase
MSLTCVENETALLERITDGETILAVIIRHEYEPEETAFAAGESYPVAERLAKRGLYLPSGLSITEDEIRTVATTLKRCLTRKGSRATVTG